MAEEDATFRPEEILETLDRHGVEFVLIGGLAAVLHGAPYVTVDVDITPRAEAANLARLAEALVDLEARVRADAAGRVAVAFQPDATFLEGQQILNLMTRAGPLDIAQVPSGTRGYAELARDAIAIDLGATRVRVASLADVVRSKEAADRPKDRAALPVLRRLLEEESRRRDR